MADRHQLSNFMGCDSMTLLYLDYNCFQRSFDDPTQIRIQMEALACQEIFARTENDTDIQLVWSFMHEDEATLCPFPDRKIEAFRLSRLCQRRVGPEQAIYDQAKQYQQQERLSAKDAIHLACAIYTKVDILITCDDRFLKQARRLNLDIEIINPVDYFREE